jgi:short-subunit dehydrogenase
VVTGAGSGIGRRLALGLADRGASLALSDIDADGLAETTRLAEAQARPGGGSVRSDLLDVTDADAFEKYAEAVAGHFGRVDQLYNNAGLGMTSDIDTTALEDTRRVLDTNFWGVVHGTLAFLPHLRASGTGHVVNISSLYGLMAVPSKSAYVAAKFAVRGWTEALRTEMLLSDRPVRVTCVHPGGVRTNVARNGIVGPGYDGARIVELFETKLARTTPEKAAEEILKGVAANRSRVVIGTDAKLLDLFVRLTGSRYQRPLASFFGRNLPRAT